MFDTLGIIAFLIIIACAVMLITSIFSRKINRKLWLTVLAGSLAVFFASYAIDVNIIEKNKKPVEIDYSGITIPSPTPEPTPEPTPTPIPTPTPEPTPEPEEGDEQTPQPTDTSDEE